MIAADGSKETEIVKSAGSNESPVWASAAPLFVVPNKNGPVPPIPPCSI